MLLGKGNEFYSFHLETEKPLCACAGNGSHLAPAFFMQKMDLLILCFGNTQWEKAGEEREDTATRNEPLTCLGQADRWETRNRLHLLCSVMSSGIPAHKLKCKKKLQPASGFVVFDAALWKKWNWWEKSLEKVNRLPPES